MLLLPFLKFPQKSFLPECRLDAGSSERLNADLMWPERGLPHTCYGSEPDTGLKKNRFFLKFNFCMMRDVVTEHSLVLLSLQRAHMLQTLHAFIKKKN